VNTATLERSLFALTGVLLLSAALRWRDAGTPSGAAPAVIPPARPMAQPPSDSALEDAEDLTVTNDPFRLSNSPPDVRYDPVNEAAQSARGGGFTPPPIRPTFVLRAIVGGPPWHAVVDGIPGQPQGTVIRKGSQYDKLLVRSVTRDSVIIQGPDTSWVIRFGRQP
jgi:hypothetical protein